ncbi:MAG: phenylalanine--tRNA ligase subunit beta [Chloroflexota bacterium]|nr:phenylalanine--tRNA ligase subunit beta [Chloroflexota bacterium]MDE2961278.1 phenylalanine--tRNA ligase subunit beta [Chloroflexota bacterium]
MLIPFSWLSQYVDITLEPDELAHRLTMGGIEVGDVFTRGGWEGCVVGYVRATRPHPNADTLTLCEVDPGDGPPLEVVCGAPNVAAGQKICFARPGVTLMNMHSGRREELKPATIRGVVSEGMICSEAELEISDEHEGIIVLPDDAVVGTPLDEALGDTFLELELTPNRGDCLSILGVAREIGAITGQPVRVPETGYAETDVAVETLAQVTIEDPDLCPRYTASVITGISIGPSPQWLQERLNRAGLRPINNVVDVTNYVMLEFNQPLHAFDLDTVTDHHVVVRRATDGEKFTTLDKVNRELTTDNLLIADPAQAIGIGGVMGGANSEITAATTNMLLESATFHPLNNRRTSTDLNLRTEASLRFEKGLRPELAPIALRRATQLILETAGGQAAAGIIDVFPGGDAEVAAVPLTAARLRQVLGMDLDIARAETVLASLGIVTRRTGPDSLEADPPYWRSDIAIEEDLIEEVIRIIGYDEVPTTMLSSPIPYHRPNEMTALKDALRDALSAAGMQETISYPLVSAEDLDRLTVNGEADGEPVRLRVANPMSTEQDIMRPTLAASILNTLAYNRGHNDGGFRLFELGRAFIPQATGLPVEREIAAGVMSGPRYDANWLSSGEPLDFFDLSGTLAAALERVGIRAALETDDQPMFHPGRCARVTTGAGNGTDAGVIGELHPDIRAAFDLGTDPVVYFEVRLDDLLEAGPDGGRFQSLSRFPAANRDLALVVPADVPAARVQGLIERVRLVERAELFDVYAGENLPEGTRSLAFRIRFRAADRTLTAEDVNRAVNGLTRALEREAGATVRT